MGTSLKERGKAFQASAAKFIVIQCPHLLCEDDLRILENAVRTQFYGYLTENNLISSKQFGFRLKSSAVAASAQFIDQVLPGMDNGTVTGAVFLDLTKAFDTVNHSILSRYCL